MENNNELTLYTLFNAAVSALEIRSVPDPKTDAWLLMEHCFGITRSRYFIDRNKLLMADDERIVRYRSLVEKRGQRIPLQYLTGEQGFMDLVFHVDSSVLIPRQDTEILVEAVLEYAGKERCSSVMDVCTGSGCIAVSLDHLGKFERVDAVDLSDAALDTAKRNNTKNNTSVRFFKSNMFENVTERYDIIVSNPPYICREEIDKLEPEVAVFEPGMALDGGEDGLDFYRIIISQAKEHLNPGGAVFLEIGYDQWMKVRDLFLENSFAEPVLIKDLAGCDRVVWAVCAEQT